MKPRRSIFSSARLFTAVTLVCGGAVAIDSARADINWDGDNSAGNMTYDNNWYGNSQPGWGFGSGNLVFNYNNGSATSIYYDYGSWNSINDIIWETTYSGAVSLDGNGQGIDFNQRLENRSSSAQTIGSTMLLSGAKNGASQIELNPVNGDLTINGTIYNENSRGYAVYGNNGKSLTLGSALGVGGTPGNVTFTVQQNSNVVVNATQAWTGATTINAGTLSIGSGGTVGALNSSSAISIASGAKLIVNRSDAYALSNTVSGAGALQKDGAGTLTLAAQKTYTGGTTINGGTLDLTGGGGTGGTIRGTVTVNSGGTLRLSTGDATGYGTGSDRLSTININGGTLHVNTTGNQTVSNAAITLTGGTISGIAGSNIDLFNNGTSVTSLASATQSTISIPSMNLRQNDTVFNIADGAAANDLLISSAIGNGSGGNHNMIKSGAGTMALSGASTFTGSTGIRDGVVILTGGNNRLPTTASVILGNSTTSGKLALDGISQTVGSLTTAGTGTANAVVGGNATASTLTVSNSTDLTYAGKLGGAGTNENNFALAKSAAGNLTLSGTNTYTGATTLSGGTLTISGSTNTGSGAVAFNGGTLQIGNGGSFTTTGTASPSGTGGGYNVNAGGTLTVGALNLNWALGNQTVDGTLNVAGDFTTSWAATKALAGTGTINAGGYKSRNYSTLNINTALTLNVSGQVNLGDGSGQNGDINQSAGTVNFNTSTAGGIRIAHWGGETSNYNLSGGILNAPNSYFGVGWDGIGIFKVSGTGVANLKELKLGANSNTANIFYLGDGFAGNSGGRLNLGASGITKQTASTINLGDGTIGAYADWSSSAAMVLTSNTTFNTLDSVDNTTGRTITLSSVLSGAGGLTKTGAGTLKITTRGTYTGATVINGGILELATPSYGRALTTSGITVNAGATLNINNTNILYDSGSPNVYIPITVNGGTVALISTAGGSHNHFGALTLNAGTIWGKSTSPYANQYSSIDADITVGGSATSTIKGDSASFHFGLVNNRTFTVASTGDVSGVDLLVSTSLGDAGGLIKAGAGMMRLTGNNTYTGNTTIDSGTLQVTGASAYLYNGGFTNTPVITANTGGTLKLDSFAYGAAGGTGQLADYRQRRVLNGGTFEISGGTHSSGNNFTVNATTGGTFRYNPTVTTDTLTLGGNGNTDIQVDGPLTVDTLGNIAIGENIAGTGSLIKTGAQTLTLSGGNSYSGGIILSTGQLNINSATALGATAGTFTISGGTVIDNTSGGSVTLSNNNAQNWNGDFTFAGSNALNLGTGAVAMDASRQVTVSASTLTVGGVISGSGFGLTKAGTGTLILNGANTYTGTTTVNQGTLEVNAKSGDVTYVVAQGATLRMGYSTGGGYSPGITVNGNGVSDAAGLYILGGKTVQTNGGLLLDTAPTTIRSYGTGNAGIQGFDVNGSYFLKTTAAASGSVVDSTINVYTGSYGYRAVADVGAATATGDLTIAGVISGSGAAQVGGESISTGFHKWGLGSLKLTNASTYGAGTSINQGSIILSGGDNRLPTGTTVALGNGGGSGKLVLGDASGAVNQTIAGLVTNGTGTANAVVGGNSSNSTLTINNTQNYTFGGTIGGAGTNENNVALTKSGAGTLTLTGSSTYAGNTAVNEGRINVNGSITSAATVAANAFVGGDGTITGAVSLSGTLLPGQGGATDRTLTINGNVTTTAGSAISFTIDAMNDHDQLVIGAGGSIDLGSADLAVSFDSGLSFTNLAAGEGADFLDAISGNDFSSINATWFRIIEGDTTGMFANVTDTLNSTELAYLGLSGTQYAYSADNGQRFWVAEGSTYLVAIPEPRAALIGGLGLLLLLRRRR